MEEPASPKPESDLCPKCGATMEIVAPKAASRLRLCPNCKLLAWDEDDGQVQTREHIIRSFDKQISLDINRVEKSAPHDLRRTYAKLAHKGGAKLDQIQLSLGHASLTTTERYLGVHQDLHDAPRDYIKLDLSAAE